MREGNVSVSRGRRSQGRSVPPHAPAHTVGPRTPRASSSGRRNVQVISARALTLAVAQLLLVIAWIAPAAAAGNGAERAPVITTGYPAPSVGAASGILIAGDGSVLWQKDPRQRRAIASTTKIMTALITLERTKPSDIVTASPRAEAVGANDPLVTEIELTAGEKLTVEELLYGLLLPSGSDAAVALAEYVGGSVEGFARLMNARAAGLGATDTNFTNPDGLDDPKAYSTARDLALIARAALENQLFGKIVATRRKQIPWAGRPAPRDLINRNELLGTFKGATGIKTGNTQNAGRSLVASATRGGEDRISVILGSPDPFGDSARVLEFGFQGFSRFVVTRAGQRWGQITYGDGTTYDLVGTKEVSVLVGATGPPPRSRFRPRDRLLVVDVPGGLTAALQVRCGRPRCDPPRRAGPGLLASLISVFAPVLGALR